VSRILSWPRRFDNFFFWVFFFWVALPGMNNAKFAPVIAEPLKLKSGHADMEQWKNFLLNISNYF
jgi:hypothetical protein